MRWWSRAVALLLSLMVGLPAASASFDEVLEVASIQHIGETGLQGHAVGIWVHQESRLDDLQLIIEADRMVATQHNQSYFQSKSIGPLATAVPMAPQDPRTIETGPVLLTLSSKEARSQLLVFDVERGLSVALDASLDAALSTPVDQVSYGPHGFSTQAQTGAGEQDPQSGFPSGSMAGPFIFSTSEGLPDPLDVVGDLRLDLRGIDLHYEADGDQGRLYSGTSEEPVDPSQPGAARFVHQASLRLELHGARLLLAGETGQKTTLQLVLKELDAVSQGGTVLRDAAPVDLLTPPQDIRLDATDVLHADPQEDRIRVAPAEPAVAAELLPQTTMADPTQGPGAAGILVVLTVSMALAGAALAVYVVRMRAARKVDMPHVEAALEAGQFREAARLARRVIRRDPFRDGAAIALAVAYTREGRPEAAVRSARRHLRLKDPGDGVLHYVMGMALLDLGRRQEARTAMEEAVERTPALSDEVAHLLGQQVPAQDSVTEGVAYV